MVIFIGALVSAGTAIYSAYSAKRAGDKDRRFAREQSDTAHQREVADLRAAGLNPILSATGGRGAEAMTTRRPVPGAKLQEASTASMLARSQIKLQKEQAETERTKQHLNWAHSLTQGKDQILKHWQGEEHRMSLEERGFKESIWSSFNKIRRQLDKRGRETGNIFKSPNWSALSTKGSIGGPGVWSQFMKWAKGKPNIDIEMFTRWYREIFQKTGGAGRSF